MKRSLYAAVFGCEIEHGWSGSSHIEYQVNSMHLRRKQAQRAVIRHDDYGYVERLPKADYTLFISFERLRPDGSVRRVHSYYFTNLRIAQKAVAMWKSKGKDHSVWTDFDCSAHQSL